MSRTPRALHQSQRASEKPSFRRRSKASSVSVVEDTARRQGYAVAIGHPHRGTIEALKAWLPEVRARGFALVPMSAIFAFGHTADQAG